MEISVGKVEVGIVVRDVEAVTPWRLLIIEDPEGTCHVEVTTRTKAGAAES